MTERPCIGGRAWPSVIFEKPEHEYAFALWCNSTLELLMHEVLGVARHTLSRVLNGHAAISPDMAIRLEKAGWSNADFWLRRQTSYDLAQARKGEDRIRVERYQPQPTA